MSVLHKFHEKHAWVWRLVVALAAMIAILVFARAISGH
jgi:hypothetical protein